MDCGLETCDLSSTERLRWRDLKAACPLYVHVCSRIVPPTFSRGGMFITATCYFAVKQINKSKNSQDTTVALPSTSSTFIQACILVFSFRCCRWCTECKLTVNGMRHGRERRPLWLANALKLNGVCKMPTHRTSPQPLSGGGRTFLCLSRMASNQPVISH